MAALWPGHSEPATHQPKSSQLPQLRVHRPAADASARADASVRGRPSLAQEQCRIESLDLAQPDEGLEPYSLQWFLMLEAHRYGRRGRWLSELLEFSKHSGETVLGLGEGLGTDWLQYARHGAQVVCCQAKAADLAVVRRNFELRYLNARFLQAAPTHLPLPSESVDVVCLHGILHYIGRPREVTAEIERVLRPGGKVLAVVPARSYPWLRWLRTKAPAPRTLSFSRRQLCRLFPGFTDHVVHKRHLRRRDYQWFCRWIPRPILERLIGDYFILRAFKPISAPALRLAA
jgi:SAM-dependent methyltransferase